MDGIYGQKEWAKILVQCRKQMRLLGTIHLNRKSLVYEGYHTSLYIIYYGKYTSVYILQ